MIPARKSRLFRSWFGTQVEKRLRQTFDGLHLHGGGNLRQALATGPVLVVSNHTSWWDALVILHLTDRLLGSDAHALMDGRNLRERPYFARVGAFGIDLEDPTDGARGLRYAARLLDRPGRLVWVFPQGKEQAEGVRPLAFQPGAAAIARLAPKARVVPVALRYVFGEAEHPEVHIVIGAPLDSPPKVADAVAVQENAVGALLDGLQAHLGGAPMAGATERLPLHRPGLLGRLAERLLAFLTRPHGSRLLGQ